MEPAAHLFVVSDRYGFVGAFTSSAAADAAVLQLYPSVPLLVHRYPAAAGPADVVWVVPHCAGDAVAFVSNSREEAARAQAAYVSVGLAYDDPVDHWEQPVGTVAGPVLARLAAQAAARASGGGGPGAGADGGADAEAEADADAGPDLSARFSILDAVVPVGHGGPPGLGAKAPGDAAASS